MPHPAPRRSEDHWKREPIFSPLPPYSGGEGLGVRGDRVARRGANYWQGPKPPHSNPSPPEYRWRGEPMAQCFRHEDKTAPQEPQHPLVLSWRAPAAHPHLWRPPALLPAVPSARTWSSDLGPLSVPNAAPGCATP